MAEKKKTKRPAPGDAKPSDAKPADAKPADAKPADAKPADAKPSGAKTGGGKTDTPKVAAPPGPQPVPEPVPEPVPDLGPDLGEAAAEDRSAALEAEIGALKDQLLRAMAETENTRKRLTKDRDEALKYGAANFAKDVLGIADNLRRALESVPAEALGEDTPIKALADGVKLTEDELLATMKRHGVERIEPLGEKFDPNLHQAVMQLENTGKPPGTVAQVLAPGYVLNGRLLRPAMVGIAAGDSGDAPKVDTSA